jgi:hypothetical protein
LPRPARGGSASTKSGAVSQFFQESFDRLAAHLDRHSGALGVELQVAGCAHMLWQLLHDERGVISVSINDVELFRLVYAPRRLPRSVLCHHNG